MLAAALAGLGRINADQAARAGFSPAPTTRWTRAIDQAAREHAPGAVALLAGVGMQTGELARRPAPLSVPHRPRRCARSGIEYEARMIAAEAMARL